MTPIVLWGATGQARVLAEFVPALGYRIAALIDVDPLVDSFLLDVPILRGRAELDAWRATVTGEVAALIAIGGPHGAERLDLQAALTDAGYRVPSVVHPSAFVAADAAIGRGSQILALAAVCAGSHVGEGCIINTGASVDHECVIEDGVHVAPRAALAGNVRVGRGAFVGAGATIVPRATIGAYAVVGAGAVVLSDIPPHAVAYGNPARVARITV